MKLKRSLSSHINTLYCKWPQCKLFSNLFRITQEGHRPKIFSEWTIYTEIGPFLSENTEDTVITESNVSLHILSQNFFIHVQYVKCFDTQTSITSKTYFCSKNWLDLGMPKNTHFSKQKKFKISLHVLSIPVYIISVARHWQNFAETPVRSHHFFPKETTLIMSSTLKSNQLLCMLQ